MGDVQVLGFAGSLRAASFNRALLRAAQEMAPPGMVIQIFDLAPLPLYNADVETAGFPEPVRQFQDRIRGADALLIASTEYNFSVSGVLKNAIDWASRPPTASPLSGKPAALMGASTSRMGSVRSQLHLRQVLGSTDTLVMTSPYVHVAQPKEKFDAAGRLTDELTRSQVKALLEALDVWARGMSGWGPSAALAGERRRPSRA
ncbi:MAG TPA: NAD(P)H-dependent oxidoreductase [Gemmatimonadales bacterium]|nr:NAD(P)H-dependent oxidoreductase [Gemmatimonadales bacterium]